MRVALFDQHTGGYHVEMGSALRNELDGCDESVTVDFVVPELTDRHREAFPPERLVALPGFESEGGGPESGRYRRDAVRAAVSFFAGSDYDLVQLVEIDDVLEYVYHYAREGPDLPPLFGRLDGGRFFRNTRRHRVATAISRHPLGNPVLRGLHRRFFGTPRTSAATKRQLFRFLEPPLRLAPAGPSVDVDDVDQLLYSLLKPAVMENAMREGVFEHVFAQTPGAVEYLRRLAPGYADGRVSEVPDPVEIWFEDVPAPEVARDRLGIDADGPVLLTFGELRREKGVDVLLDALERYDGPALTMVIVGKPVDVGEAEIRAAGSRIDVPIHDVLEFVPDADVPLYFAAADGVVVPYRRTFGYERTSGPFQKAAATCRPVLAPRFGFFERRVAKWNLGLTFEPGSAADLARQLRTFAADPVATYDPASTREYARSQSYDALANQLLAVYREWG